MFWSFLHNERSQEHSYTKKEPFLESSSQQHHQGWLYKYIMLLDVACLCAVVHFFMLMVQQLKQILIHELEHPVRKGKSHQNRFCILYTRPKHVYNWLDSSIGPLISLPFFHFRESVWTVLVWIFIAFKTADAGLLPGILPSKAHLYHR